ncbi:MAG: hypothetical protein WCX65_12185 [bacterium]
MNCDRFNEIVHDYIDGELDEIREAAAAEHIAACDCCAREVRAFRRTREMAKQYGAELAPEGFEESVRERIDAETRARRRSRRQDAARTFPFRIGHIPRWASLAATFAIVILAGGYLKLFYLSPAGSIQTAKIVTPNRVISEAPEEKIVLSEKAGMDAATSETPAPVEPRESAAAGKSIAAAEPVKDKIATDNIIVASEEKGAGKIGLASGGGAAGYTASSETNADGKSYVRFDAESMPLATQEARAFENAVERYELQHALGGTGTGAGAADYSLKKEGAIAVQPEVAHFSKSAVAADSESRPMPAGAMSPSSAPVIAELTSYDTAGDKYSFSPPAAMPYYFDEADAAQPESALEQPSKRSAAPGAAAKAPGSVKVASAMDVINTTNPRDTLKKCTALMNEFLKANPTAKGQWQQNAGRFIVSGKYKTMVALREKLAAEFGGRKQAPAAAASEKAKAAAKPEYDTDKDAVLAVYIRPMKTPPAAAAASPAAPAKAPAAEADTKSGGK